MAQPSFDAHQPVANPSWKASAFGFISWKKMQNAESLLMEHVWDGLHGISSTVLEECEVWIPQTSVAGWTWGEDSLEH